MGILEFHKGCHDNLRPARHNPPSYTQNTPANSRDSSGSSGDCNSAGLIPAAPSLVFLAYLAII